MIGAVTSVGGRWGFEGSYLTVIRAIITASRIE